MSVGKGRRAAATGDCKEQVGCGPGGEAWASGWIHASSRIAYILNGEGWGRAIRYGNKVS